MKPFGVKRLIRNLDFNRRKMTICIAAGAALNSENASIILCTDWLTSTEIGGSEVMLKQRMLLLDFFYLPSGSEAQILDLLRSLNVAFRGLKKDIFLEDEILKATRLALFNFKREMADIFIKSRYGMSYDDFYGSGISKMPPDLFREEMAQISRMELETEVIIAGFAGKFALLIETTSSGGASIKEDFVTVGSGSYLASASLMQREYMDVWPLDRCIYAIFEAKKYSERIGTVGKQSLISVIKPDGKRFVISQEGLKELEGLYEKYGPQQVPLDMKFDSEFFAPVPT